MIQNDDCRVFRGCQFTSSMVQWCHHWAISDTHDVRKDTRTILETPRQYVDDKTFIHLGLKQRLHRILTHYGYPNDSDTLYLKLNIDGVPLSDSNSAQLWPILCIVSNVKRHPPFFISMYCGRGKLHSLEHFFDNLLMNM